MELKSGEEEEEEGTSDGFPPISSNKGNGVPAEDASRDGAARSRMPVVTAQPVPRCLS